MDKELIKKLRQSQKESVDRSSAIAKDIEPRILRLIREHIENLRWATIISGSISLLSLTLLESDYVQNTNLLLTGIIVLLVGAIVSIWHLHHYIWGEIKSYSASYNFFMKPEKTTQKSINDFIKGKIDEDEFIRINKRAAKALKAYFNKTFKEVNLKDPWGEFINYTIIVGITLVMLSLISSSLIEFLKLLK